MLLKVPISASNLNMNQPRFSIFRTRLTAGCHSRYARVMPAGEWRAFAPEYGLYDAPESHFDTAKFRSGSTITHPAPTATGIVCSPGADFPG